MSDSELLPNDTLWERLFEAVSNDDVPTLRQLVAHERNQIGGSNFSDLLNEAAHLDRLQSLTVLVDICTPSDIDRINEGDRTPLISATSHGQLEMVQMLLAAGFDPDVAPEMYGSLGRSRQSGRCALYHALINNHQDLVRLLEPITSPTMRLMAYEALEWHRSATEPLSTRSRFTTLLFMAVQQGKIDQVRDAISEGGDVNARLPPDASNAEFGSTPLSFAAGRGRLDLVEVLLEAGADPRMRSHDGLTPADFADLNGYPEVAVILRTK